MLKPKSVFRVLIVSGIVLLMTCCALNANEINRAVSIDSEKRAITVTAVTSGLDHPWSIAFISATDWLVTERSGQLRRVVDGVLLTEPVSGLPEIVRKGQGGLLDVVLHPQFAENRRVYLSYAKGNNGLFSTEVLYGTLTDNRLHDINVVFRARPRMPGGRHFGSRLVFDDQGYLFISLGDRGDPDRAQKLNEHTGSIIRLHDDGSVPDSNPFVNRTDALPEIYSYGHRNIQGFAFDAETNTLWAHEHGPQGGDELNRVLAGQNYGWPVITYGVNYGSGTKIGEGTEKDGLLQPVTFWDPSIAPSGLAVVTSTRYPEWKGNVLVGALKFQLIARLELQQQSVEHEERLFEGQFGRIRDVRQSPDGFIYFLTDSSDGVIYRVE